MKEILKNIYQIDVTLPNSPLKLLHVYLIVGKERNLLIDTGFNHPVCKEALLDELKKLDIKLDETDIFLTHLHSDHTGLVCSLMTGKNKVYIGQKDGVLMNALTGDAYREIIIGKMILAGTPLDKRVEYEKHPAIAQKLDYEVDYTPIKEGYLFEIGDYKLKVLDLSGHTPEQLGLYEEKNNILFCGDHILNRITPNIIYWEDDFDALRTFLTNLNKIKSMNVKLACPSHRGLIENINHRIDEIIAHHEQRLDETLKSIMEDDKTVYEIAQNLTWDFGGGDFSKFPNQQLWFAVSEAFAHAEYLRHKGVLQRYEESGVLKYNKLK